MSKFSLLSVLLVVVSCVTVQAESYHIPLNQIQTYGFDGPQRRQIASSIPLTNQNHDIKYLAAISVGTPPQQLRVTIGIATASFWLASPACTSCNTSLPRFHSSASSTFRPVPAEQITIRYSGGTVTGPQSSDRVTVGDFTLASQVFVSATDVSPPSLIGPPSSGVLGLAFSGLSSTVGTPVWESLLTANRLSTPLFGIWITRVNNVTAAAYLEPGGVLTLGGTNSSLYTGDIEFIDMPPVATLTFWQLFMTGFSINGIQISITASTSLSAFDIGNAIIGGPSADVRRIWAAVPSAVALTDTNGLFHARLDLVPPSLSDAEHGLSAMTT